MIVTLIVLCEVGFWVLLAAGLATRYLLRMRRTGLVLLLVEPLLELVLLTVTVLDLRNGAEPSWRHGLAALYIGYTAGHGHRTVRWLDGHAAHRLGGGPPPAKPPRHGTGRARHEGRVWLGTVVGTAVATVLLQAAVWYVGDPARTGPLEDWMHLSWRVAAFHGLFALIYAIFPKRTTKRTTKRSPRKAAEGLPEPEPEPEPVPGPDLLPEAVPERESEGERGPAWDGPEPLRPALRCPEGQRPPEAPSARTGRAPARSAEDALR
ncbi:hypothetical protein SCWH03_18970 [Streptomyces pacificus]|uniref:Uncharacterized protein n=1 Tax=Streptomyces pacificus TaxID=2705029 RepID=A0A6A0ARX8_9ACTN|nr:hypothetical protein SCWH03_18970 [Streptomyces pacificus]